MDYTLTANTAATLSTVRPEWEPGKPLPIATGLEPQIATLNPDRKIDIEPTPWPIYSTPPTPGTMASDGTFTAGDPGVIKEWGIGVRVNDDGLEPNWPKGVKARARAEGDGGFAVPLASVETPDGPIVMPVPLIDQVRSETLHRLCVAFGARDQEHLTIKVQDATIQAGVLTDKMARGETLTAEEQGLAAYLRQATALYMAIKDTGNQFETMATTNTLPANWRSDKNWPSSGGM